MNKYNDIIIILFQCMPLVIACILFIFSKIIWKKRHEVIKNMAYEPLSKPKTEKESKPTGLTLEQALTIWFIS